MKLNEDYWRQVRERAAALGSDGCTGVPDWFLDCYLEHDLHWVHGQAIAAHEANWVFKR